MNISLELAYDRQQEVLQLFTEYTDMILREGEEVRCCLKAQHYGAEICTLETMYGLPMGRLYIAYLENDAVGCVALKNNGALCCEVKRLYVRPGYRGKHIGKSFIEQVIRDAKKIGYRYMRLDTFPFMNSAVRLYRQYGFYEIERYNRNPATTALYFQLDL